MSSDFRYPKFVDRMVTWLVKNGEFFEHWNSPKIGRPKEGFLPTSTVYILHLQYGERRERPNGTLRGDERAD